jgi:hypothetical protein
MRTTSERTDSVIGAWARDRLTEGGPDGYYLLEVLSIVEAMDLRGLWREVAGLLRHGDEDVVVAALELLGAWEEVRSFPEILEFWDRDPRHRLPRVAEILRTTARSLTGESIESPDAFRVWLG